MEKKIKSLLLLFILLLTVFMLNASDASPIRAEKLLTVNTTSLNNSHITFQSTREQNVRQLKKNYSYGGIQSSVSTIVTGVLLTLCGAGVTAVGIPMWYYSAIGLGYIKYHPGIIEVRPLDGNRLWLFTGYGFGVCLLILGPAMLLGGVICIIIGATTVSRRASLYLKNNLADNSTSVGIAIKI